MQRRKEFSLRLLCIGNSLESAVMRRDMGMSQISVNDLTFYYDGSYDSIFEKVSFQIDTDWKLGLIGRNGRGKTTFLNLLLGKYEYKGSITSSVSFDYFPFGVEDKKKLTIDIVEDVDSTYELWKICRELNASADEILEGLMEADVDVRDVEEEDGEITVYADQDQFHAVQTALNEMGITEFEVAELTMLPTSTVELEGDALAKFLKLLDVLEDLDDVQQVHHNVELPEEEE